MRSEERLQIPPRFAVCWVRSRASPSRISKLVCVKVAVTAFILVDIHAETPMARGKNLPFQDAGEKTCSSGYEYCFHVKSVLLRSLICQNNRRTRRAPVELLRYQAGRGDHDSQFPSIVLRSRRCPSEAEPDGRYIGCEQYGWKITRIGVLAGLVERLGIQYLIVHLGTQRNRSQLVDLDCRDKQAQ